MSVSDNFSDQHEGQNLHRPKHADAEDPPVQQEQAAGKITSLTPRQSGQNTQPLTASDEMIDQIERMEKLLEAQAKFLNDMQSSLKEAIAGQVTKQGLKQEERMSSMLISFKEAFIEQRDQISKMQASLMGAVIEQRDQISKMQISLTEQARISATIDNRGTNPANQADLNFRQSASKEQGKPADIRHITCMVAMPFKDNADTFAYDSILLPALRTVLELPPYCWQVIRADEMHLKDIIQDNIRDLMNQADAYIVDISDENPNVMMELGYMLWSRKPNQPLIVLKREGTGRYLADLAGFFCKKYPATQATGRFGIDEVAKALEKEFHDHQDIQALNTPERLHYLSPVFLDKVYGMNYETAKKLSQGFTTMEAVEKYSNKEYQKEYDLRTKDIQKEQAEGARKFIIEKLMEIKASYRQVQ